MNQIMSWICLISICILCLQVMIFICEDTLKLFNSIILNNKNKRKKPAKQQAFNLNFQISC